MTAALFDPELAARLAAFPQLLAPVTPNDIDAVRKGATRLRPSDAQLQRGGAIALEQRAITTPDGAELPLLLLRPTAAGRAAPGLLFLHGGGMIAGDAFTGIEVALDWVTELGLCVASVAYRLAPENPYPTPLEDAYTALCWLNDHREAAGVDTGPLLLAGSSAGGGLAAGIALLARDRAGPHIDTLLLMAPMLDDRARFASSKQFGGNAPWDAQSNRTGWAGLLGDKAEGPDVTSYAAPGRADDLSSLPSSFLDVGAMETFRDETIAFATRLAQAGVPVELHVWSGAFHGFDVIAAESQVARAAHAVRLNWLRRRLRDRAPTT